LAGGPGHIVIDRVAKRFGGHQALEDVSLSIARGEFLTLLGPSGCGKTTLLRAIAGFHRQDSGTIAIAGKVVDDLPAHRRDTGMVFQNYAVFPHMTVFDNVAYGLRARKVAGAELARRVREALARVHLADLGERFPAQLSGGQKQRVGLARALVIEPSVLLMDEPLSNLDAKLRVLMRQDIRLVQKELGITTIYVTHDQEEALAVSDRIAVMERGVLRQVGAPKAIYDDPQHAFVADFIGSSTHLPGALERDGFWSVQIANGPKVALAGEVTGQPGMAVTVSIRPEHFQPLAESTAAALPCVAGRLVLASYLGPRTRLTVEVAGSGERIEAEVASNDPVAGAAQGAVVRLAFAAGDMRVFARDGGRRVA
jgi:ABC-type Fe3+/spermidine/putrescine transport system ATPase subunit